MPKARALKQIHSKTLSLLLINAIYGFAVRVLVQYSSGWPFSSATLQAGFYPLAYSWYLSSGF